MKFGLALPYNIARDVPHLARLAEDAGWDGIFLGDAIWHEDPMIALTAAAVNTSRICLGPMIIPVPLRQPWKIASESVALDRLSDGRLILGLGTGAVWMGWHAFPDVVTENKARAEMLDESIDIVTKFFEGKPFDFSGQHYRLKLSTLDEMYYPPQPVQQPRIPLWVPAVWSRKKSMRRVLKCEGILPEKLSTDGTPEDITPKDIRDIRSFVDNNRTLTTPFDIVMTGKTKDLSSTRKRRDLDRWAEAGVTWWIEDLIGDTVANAAAVIQSGPPLP